MTVTKHIPVLLHAVMNTLGDINGKTIVDATFGAGGYSTAFLNAGANVIAFDRDPNVVQDAEILINDFNGRFDFIPRPFSSIVDLPGTYDAIVFDLGISSMQIDIPERGFSFRGDGPLDMRMSVSGMTAAELISDLSVEELAQILRDYGDVKKATILARAIKNAKPRTTFELKELIHNPHDVAPVFQALRIAVNDEMGELNRALVAVPEKLKVGGKCICVTFHSIEDRIVKNKFKEWTSSVGDPRMPVVTEPQFVAIKTETPTTEELENNNRARSAHMRGVIKSY